VTGGYVYRGKHSPHSPAGIFFADYVGWRIFAAQVRGRQNQQCGRRVYAADRRAAKRADPAEESAAASSFGEDRMGSCTSAM